VVGKNDKFVGVSVGEVIAIDPRDALSRALTADAGNGQLVAEICRVPIDVIDNAPGNGDTTLDIELEHLMIKLRKTSLASFDPSADWKSGYNPWRHGGWYTDVVYPSRACGCVSKNYPDKKWKIVCDRRRANNEPGELGDFTYPTRDAAARAEFSLAKLAEAGLYPSD